VLLWSWDRTEDLSFLSGDAGVALVMASVELVGSEFRLRPRRATLIAPASTPILPVVHVDALPRWEPALTALQETRLVQTIVETARHAKARAVQIDFEALPSQRSFYLRVLHRVRQELPDTYLSMTALASWCMGDRWTHDAPVDETVAMAFRIGAAAEEYRQIISRLAQWQEPRCTSTGVATDEPVLKLPVHQRLYVFSPRPWTSARWKETRAAYISTINN